MPHHRRRRQRRLRWNVGGTALGSVCLTFGGWLFMLAVWAPRDLPGLLDGQPHATAAMGLLAGMVGLATLAGLHRSRYRY